SASGASKDVLSSKEKCYFPFKIYRSVRNSEKRLHFSHVFHPCGKVGGDFYHTVSVNEHAFMIFLCDVMGHGVRSALVTALIRAQLDNCTALATHPAQLLTQMNERLCCMFNHLEDTLFATACCGYFDLSSGVATFACGGHHNPLVFHKGKNVLNPFETTQKNIGPALGLFPNATYHECMVDIHDDHVFMFYTDGVTEVLNEAQEEFGLHRLTNHIKKDIDLDGRLILSSIMQELITFSGRREWDDDICIFAIDIVETGPVIEEDSDIDTIIDVMTMLRSEHPDDSAR
ncbi:MAG: serine/threonine-protein phosphatase, partial [Spartobacteria bacterium]|nr:serine/threonine-protein phosphatase [Spartobacteria bacterium]